MFVRTAQEEDVTAGETHVASDDIAGEGGVGVAYVGFVVYVVDGCGDLKGSVVIVGGCGGEACLCQSLCSSDNGGGGG